MADSPQRPHPNDNPGATAATDTATPTVSGRGARAGGLSRPPAGPARAATGPSSGPTSGRSDPKAAPPKAAATTPPKATASGPKQAGAKKSSAGGKQSGASGEPAANLNGREERARRWVPPLLSALVLLAGVVDLVSVLTPEIHSRLRTITRLVTGPVAHSASAATVGVGLLLVLLATALRRRKRRAWRGVVVLLGASAVLDVLKGLDIEESVLSLAVLGLLVAYRREFQAEGDPRTRWRALGAFLALTVASLVLGLLLLYIRSRDVIAPHPFSAELEQVLYGLVGASGPLKYANDRFEDFAAKVLFAMGLLTAATTVYLALRPAEPQAGLAPDDEERMRALLAAHGTRDSLGYFALRRDKSVLWSPSGKACICYRVVSGVLLASGDPLGDPEAWPGAIEPFLDLAARHAWTPAVMGCSEQAGLVWARHGLDALELGDEAIVEVPEFSLDGRAMRNVRQAVARVERAGYDFEMRRVADIGPDDVELIRARAAAWRGAEVERGFSMSLGRFGDPLDGECVLATATKDGTLAALLLFVPWGPHGLSLDVMRRDREADNGLNEFLIARVLSTAGELGVTRVSLNFAVFRSALARGEKLGAGFVLRGWRNILVFTSRWFQIESLYRFNAKFQPIWEPRYICYPAARDLPRIAVAALEAEAFIVWPRPSLRFLRGIVGGPHPARPARISQG